MTTNCLFCKIIKGTIPSCKVIETEFSYGFLDIAPLSKGHALVIPKFHAQFLHELPDEYLSDLLPTAKKVALALGPKANYNLLQNNGRLAHQAVDHVHFHIIPKSETEGLEMEWKSLSLSQDELKRIAQDLSSKIH